MLGRYDDRINIVVRIVCQQKTLHNFLTAFNLCLTFLELKGGISKPFFKQNQKVLCWAVVVAQLAERSLPIPEDPGSNPVIGNFY